MKKADYILIFGLAFVFGCFGSWKLIDPYGWTGWLPLWLNGFLGIPLLTWSFLIGIAEIVLTLALFWPLVRFWAVLGMTLHLLAILIVVGFTEIGVRDAGLFAMALYLTVVSFPWKK